MTDRARSTIGAILFALLVALSAVTASVALGGTVAAQSHDVEVAVGSDSAGTGQQATVDLSLESGDSGAQGVAGYEVTLRYDPTVVEFAGFETGGFAEPVVNDEQAGDGQVTILAQQANDPVDTPLDPASVTFDVVGGAGEEAEIAVHEASVQDRDAAEYDIETSAGSVSVTGDGDVEPATFEVSNASIAGESVIDGDVIGVDSDETVGVSATVTNAGDLDGTDGVRFEVGNETVAAETGIELESGASTDVSFTELEVPDRFGEYEYRFATDDDEVAGTLDVSAAYDVEIALDDEVEAEPNETVSVGMEALAPGDETATVGGYEVEIAFDDDRLTFEGVDGAEFADPVVNDENAEYGRIVVQGAQATDPAETPLEALSVSFTAESEGSADVTFESEEVRANATTAYEVVTTPGSVAIADDDGGGEDPGPGPGLPPAPPDPGEPNVQVADASLSPSEIEVGGSIDVTATIENLGDASGTSTVPVTVDGNQIATESVSLDAGSTATLTVTETFDEPGTYNVSVGEVSAGTVTVEDASDGGDGTDDDGSDDTDGGTSDDGDGTPGFGPVVAIIALLAVVAVGRTRTP